MHVILQSLLPELSLSANYSQPWNLNKPEVYRVWIKLAPRHLVAPELSSWIDLEYPR